MTAYSEEPSPSGAIMNREQLREMIDACRPGHNDVDDENLKPLADELCNDAELVSVFKRAQHADDLIGHAMRDVHVPVDAAERLLNKLETHRPAHRWRHRLAVSATAAIAIAASLLIAQTYFRRPEQVDFTSAADIADAVEVWNNQLNAEAWQPGSTAPLTVLPHDQSVPLPVARWQWAAKNRIACYELWGGNAYKVRLFVMRPKAGVPLGSAPPESIYPSRHWSTGAWQSRGCVYVLAVSMKDEPAVDVYRKIERYARAKALPV